ncbi:Rho GTPase activation protein [Pseudomassariella vexata]|uniref:Rho GTPase activation protein n=1 Tax=Pseudomassariella vexata TaxID=1141098 RepID=A0A1Y2E1X1_9PEZI|nr:Rho GTPase activation protein [Pseudomassariella vexata]ORY64865.1 Rho GTPase activation protein [Pseudomassariella vexata]
MDSFSITTDCIELGNTISRASLVLNEFVREVREARSDLDTISRELHSLQSVLTLLKEDAGNLPSKIAAQTPALLEQCNRVVSELDACLLALNGSALSKTQKRAQWIAVGKQQIAQLRAALEAHRATMGLALDLVGATSGRDLHDSSEQGDYDGIENEQQLAEVSNDVIRIVEEMAQLQAKLPGEFEHTRTGFSLRVYLATLGVYANLLTGGSELEDGGYFGVYEEDTPDSAIEVTSESSFPAFDDAPPKSPGADQYIQEVNQLMDEILDVPSRAPTPPPKDLKRFESQRRSMVTPFLDPPIARYGEESFGVVTEISSDGRKPDRPPQSKPGRFGRMLGHMRSTLSEPSSSESMSTNSEVRPSTPIIQASLVRRGSRRLSTSIKRLPLWNTELEEPEGPPSPGSNAVFGVSLQKSMQAAKSGAKTHHSGSGSSRREFPLCLHKCCVFLQTEGIEAPDIFAEPGDSFRVQKLKEVFSKAPLYGENINWDNYGVHDAADIILLYLSQLPKPLISETIAKRWISLSRQATISGPHGSRADQCIDFWEEALGGLRGTSRSIFKLLMNVWAEIADAAEKNGMTAERLASVILKPLMHTSSEKYSTDFMLAMAFLIRKRSEYIMMLNEGRKSRAAF